MSPQTKHSALVYLLYPLNPYPVSHTFLFFAWYLSDACYFYLEGVRFFFALLPDFHFINFLWLLEFLYLLRFLYSLYPVSFLWLNDILYLQYLNLFFRGFSLGELILYHFGFQYFEIWKFGVRDFDLLICSWPHTLHSLLCSHELRLY